MKITKIETNYKRKLFWSTTNISSKSYSENIENQVINIYPQITYNKLIGFGASLTEATGYALSETNLSTYNEILSEYFSKNGFTYNLCRLPIGSCDFSKSSYAYSKKEDLSDFSIEDDKKYIIPIIKKALEINPNLKFLASPWSPPKFMKTNHMRILGGKLKKEHYSTWANYITKYLIEYKKEGIDIDYITVQNEPNATQIWESCTYSPEEEIDFAVNYLYQTFQQQKINTKILIWDHNKEKLFNRVQAEMSTNAALEAISGFAFHWYSGDHFENIKITNEIFPSKLLIHSEGCTGYSHFRQEDEVKNAEIYAHDILGDLNAGINGFIDWNMVLTYKGGPNHKKNYCNSPVMISKDKNSCIKNLSYYYIGHFCKFIKPNAIRIGFSRYTDQIQITAFKNIDSSIAIVLFNQTDQNHEYNLCIKDTLLHDNLDSHAIVTYFINY